MTLGVDVRGRLDDGAARGADRVRAGVGRADRVGADRAGAERTIPREGMDRVAGLRVAPPRWIEPGRDVEARGVDRVVGLRAGALDVDGRDRVAGLPPRQAPAGVRICVGARLCEDDARARPAVLRPTEGDEPRALAEGRVTDGLVRPVEADGLAERVEGVRGAATEGRVAPSRDRAPTDGAVALRSGALAPTRSLGLRGAARPGVVLRGATGLEPSAPRRPAAALRVPGTLLRDPPAAGAVALGRRLAVRVATPRGASL